jgi:hypothetical protein
MAESRRDIETEPEQSLQERIDTTVMHPARRYDYWLGGRNNYAVDRASGDAVAEMFPTIRLAVQENRKFLRRAVQFLAREAGIRQFLDIGSGLPTSPNVHEVAQSIDPSARVVYVDNDPIVLVHARALLTSTPDGATTYLDADMRDPDGILGELARTEVLDLSQPVGLLMFAVLHFIRDDEDVRRIITALAEPLASGSHLVVSVATADFASPEQLAQLEQLQKNPSEALPRTADQVMGFLDGFELVPPGLTVGPEWRADDEPGPRPTAAEVGGYCAVARIP